jgi:hypothetical protein
MDNYQKTVSKVYRRIVTSNEVKAYMIFERLDEDLKGKIKLKLNQNGSGQALMLLKKLQ